MKEQANGLVTDLKALMGKHDGFVAVGVDVAALEDNWGICVLLIENNLMQASLSLLLPQAKLRNDGTPHATNYCRPSFAILKMILEAISEKKLPGSMGVDVPFGWPVEHKRFVNSWSAAEGWLAAEGIPERSEFEKRWCDIALNNYEPTIAPFAVGADTIAQVAHKWAICRQELSALIGAIDFGIDEIPDKGLTTFESYPGAFVKLKYPEFGDYKSKQNNAVRRALVDAISEDYQMEQNDRTSCWMQWAINQQGDSPDALDAYLCAITAWAHIRWKCIGNGQPFTSPSRVLGRQLTALDQERIRNEGWILIPAN